jgi:hypothetical protein
MLVKKCPKFKIKGLINKFSFKCASMEFEKNLDEDIKLKDKDRNTLEEWKRKTKEEQDNVLRRAHEIVRKRQDDAKKSNKEFLMKMKISGVKEDPER